MPMRHWILETMVWALLTGPALCWAAHSDSPPTVKAEDLRRQLAKSADIVMIDTRAPSLYAAFRIEGSLNAPPFALKTKTHLKSKAIVLVDQCLKYCRLLELREQLLASGFSSVRILNGGLTAWTPRQSGSVLSGVGRHLLQSALHCTRLQVHLIDLRSAKAFAQRPLNSSSRNIPVDRQNADWRSRAVAAMEAVLDPTAGRNPAEPIVLIDENGALARIMTAQTKKQRPFTFYLSGGARQWFLTEDNPRKEVWITEGGVSGGGCPSCRP